MRKFLVTLFEFTVLALAVCAGVLLASYLLVKMI